MLFLRHLPGGPENGMKVYFLSIVLNRLSLNDPLERELEIRTGPVREKAGVPTCGGANTIDGLVSLVVLATVATDTTGG
jgi:hypothetical protein